MSVPDNELWAFETRPLDEEGWSALEDLFKSRGYNFRPRLRKGWTPSWRTTGGSPLDAEDGEILRTHLVDAHTDDDKDVMIKKIVRNGEESHIIQMLNAPGPRKDPKNHAVPFIEVIDDPNDETVSYLVMPLLRNASDPPFQYVKEIMDFVDQTLEGLAYLHQKGVAHRDCVLENMLMDPKTMYPEGFHPVQTAYKRDYSGIAYHIPRSAIGVKYYYADFGISKHFQDAGSPRVTTGISGRDRDPPELSNTVPYDPFKLDVFIIGNMLKREFCDRFSNLEFIRPLADNMATPEPNSRPSAEAALNAWRTLREKVYTVHKEWRPRPREDDFLGIARDMVSAYEVSLYYSKAVFGTLLGLWSYIALGEAQVQGPRSPN